MVRPCIYVNYCFHWHSWFGPSLTLHYKLVEGRWQSSGWRKCVAVAAACPNDKEGAYMWSLPDSDVKGLAYHDSPHFGARFILHVT